MTELILNFPDEETVTLAAVGIQGPPGGGGGGGISDGDKGDITVSGSGTAWTIDPGAVTLSKMAALAASTILGNNTGSPATPIALTPTQVKALLAIVAADVSDFETATRATVLTGYAAAGSRLALAASDTVLGAFNKIGKWLADLAAVAFSGSASDLSAGTLPAARLPAFTGDATAGGGSAALTIPNNTVTFAKMADIATDTLVGRDTAATGDPEAITVGGGVEFSGAGALRTSAFTGDATKTAGGTALTLATVNSNVGSFGLAASVAQFTVNAKGLITAAVNVAISIAATAISDATTAGRAMLTAASAAAQTALLDVFTSGAKGLVPPSGGGTTNFLRADGSFVAAAQLAAAQNFTAAQGVTPVALSDGANIATDAALGNIFTVTLGGNRTLDNPTNLVAGRTYAWVVTQDGTGGRTLAYGSNFDFPGGTAPTLSAGASDVDLIVGIAISTSRVLCVANLDFS